LGFPQIERANIDIIEKRSGSTNTGVPGREALLAWVNTTLTKKRIQKKHSPTKENGSGQRRRKLKVEGCYPNRQGLNALHRPELRDTGV